MADDIPVVLPRWGATMEEATLVEWLVEVGQPVEAEQPICVVETDKVDAEVVAPQAGVLAAQTAAPDETVPVGGELARLTPS